MNADGVGIWLGKSLKNPFINWEDNWDDSPFWDGCWDLVRTTDISSSSSLLESPSSSDPPISMIWSSSSSSSEVEEDADEGGVFSLSDEDEDEDEDEVGKVMGDKSTKISGDWDRGEEMVARSLFLRGIGGGFSTDRSKK